ncbi:hypothetical protein PR202_gb03865 [Eleusine coracana subsp. coracana]|uniref:Heparan-alpha-glucosaminide N-acetyltransferase catalytic domain-containing protein n=1 Tax=Eleusine coracana subsp. coracana TaxID=191504 RepID=A0AAV5E2Z9_ELECO|nr:hypothetical protein PR202_gb03865 [Eleusine coracana subsp. coracana]
MEGSKNVERRPHGAVDEEDPGRHRAPVSEEDDDNEKAPRRSRRVASLDVFRGLTVALMILVDGAGGEWPVIGHAPWNGCNLADFVMPFFLFIVGMAIPLSLKRIPDRGRAVRRIVIRTLKLLFWGILLQGGYSHAPDELSYGVDMKHIRWGGILQRIALAYLVVAILEIVTKDVKVQDQSSSGFSIFRLYFSQWIVACCILVVYLSLVYGIYVPDWEFRVRNVDSPNFGKVLTVGDFSWSMQDCTDASPHEGSFKKDAPVWCVAPFEPEGILSSFSAVLSTIIGVHYGHVLVHMQSHRDRLKQWITMGLALLVLGLVLHFSHAIPLNKQLYTFSYVCVTAGAAGIVFSVFYFLVYWVRKHVFVRVWHSARVGILLYYLFAQILLWALVSGVLHRAGLYWKL